MLTRSCVSFSALASDSRTADRLTQRSRDRDL